MNKLNLTYFNGIIVLENDSADDIYGAGKNKGKIKGRKQIFNF